MRRVSSWVALVALAALGCTVAVSKEGGYYACADAGGCPPGTTCRLDGNCHPGEETGGEAGTACDADADCAVGLSCLEGDGAGVGNLRSVGYCGFTCDEDGDATESACPDGSVCFGDECVPTCETSDGCPSGSRCRLPELPRMGGEAHDPLAGAICADTPDMNYGGDASCVLSSMEDCRPPGFCLVTNETDPGLCSFRCEVGQNDQCAPMGVCVTVRSNMQPEWGQCFRLCDVETPDCGTDGLTCASASERGPTVCMPAAWADSIDSLTFLTPPGG